MGRNPNIIIFSASAGTGHTRAAEALKKAFLDSDSRFKVTILDTFSYSSPFLQRLVLGSYKKMLALVPALYGFLYGRSERRGPVTSLVKFLFYRMLTIFSAARLFRYIDDTRPEVIICTHPFPLGVLSEIKKRGKLACFLVGAVTDLDLHSFWVFPEADLYLVGAGRLADDLVSCGIPEERVHVTGIPIDPAFGDQVDKNDILQAYSLDHNLTTIFLMGGGLGMGPLEECVKALGSLEKSCQLIVVAGKNTRLKERIKKLSAGLPNPVCTLGYVNNVHQLMAVADIMVSKAGGLSCAEALASSLPLFLLKSLPGQEERNSRLLVSAGAAVAVSGVDDLAEKVLQCIKDPFNLKKMSATSASLGRKDAARDSVRLIYERLRPWGADNCLPGREMFI